MPPSHYRHTDTLAQLPISGRKLKQVAVGSEPWAASVQVVIYCIAHHSMFAGHDQITSCIHVGMMRASFCMEHMQRGHMCLQ